VQAGNLHSMLSVSFVLKSIGRTSKATSGTQNRSFVGEMVASHSQQICSLGWVRCLVVREDVEASTLQSVSA